MGVTRRCSSSWKMGTNTPVSAKEKASLQAARAAEAKAARKAAEEAARREAKAEEERQAAEIKARKEAAEEARKLAAKEEAARAKAAKEADEVRRTPSQLRIRLRFGQGGRGGVADAKPAKDKVKVKVGPRRQRRCGGRQAS